MHALLTETYRGGFLLKEEHLAKITDIISKRLKERNIQASVIFRVTRADSLVYETTSYAEVCEEENSKRNLIKTLEVYVKDGDNTIFTLSFDEKTTVEIESESKDFAYLLNSDLKEYLKTEVMIFRPQIFTRSRIHKAVLLIIPVLLMVLMSLMLGAEMSQKDFDNLLHPQMFRRSSISS